MTQPLSMAKLFKKLSAIGLSENYVRKIGLPSWWNYELDNQPAAVLEGAGHIAKRLHLDLRSLLTEEQGVQFKPLPHTKFKYHLQPEAAIPGTSHQLASRVAELAATGVQTCFVPIPEDVSQIRAEILKTHPTVSLESLLGYCWQHGIAVVYFNDYPDNTRKITGMIQWQSVRHCRLEETRPVIVLSSKRTHPAWLAFHLAHELGHLALGHVKEGILIDDEIRQESDDSEELDSNKFAVQLLLNYFDNYLTGEQIASAKHLENKINKCLRLDSTVDPCSMAFNYAWHTKNYGFAEKAIKILSAANDGDEIINRFLESHIDWDCLSDDNSDHLDRILGA